VKQWRLPSGRIAANQDQLGIRAVTQPADGRLDFPIIADVMIEAKFDQGFLPEFLHDVEES